MFDNELILRFINELMQDFEDNGKDKPIEEWMSDALKRHTINIPDEKLEIIKKELLEGIKAYRNIEEQNLSMPAEIDTGEIKEEIKILTESTLSDLEKIKKLQEE